MRRKIIEGKGIREEVKFIITFFFMAAKQQTTIEEMEKGKRTEKQTVK